MLFRSAQTLTSFMENNINIDKRKVVLESDIKEFGSYKADVKLYSGIVANITVKVSEA